MDLRSPLAHSFSLRISPYKWKNAIGQKIFPIHILAVASDKRILFII
jgi:hypothetical protein